MGTFIQTNLHMFKHKLILDTCTRHNHSTKRIMHFPSLLLFFFSEGLEDGKKRQCFTEPEFYHSRKFETLTHVDVKCTMLPTLQVSEVKTMQQHLVCMIQNHDNILLSNKLYFKQMYSVCKRWEQAYSVMKHPISSKRISITHIYINIY